MMVEARIADLEAESAQQGEQIAALLGRVRELEARLAKAATRAADCSPVMG